MFNQYEEKIRGFNGQLDGFSLETEGKLSIVYAPFDYVNTRAKVAIFGITPGEHQAIMALTSARDALLNGKSADDAQRIAKQAASFHGAMRNNLVEMLDYLGVNRWLDIESTSHLFEVDNTLAHFNSALRYPVFVDGKNYSGRTPKMLNHPMLKRMIDDILVDEVAQLGEGTLLIPLGAAVEEALIYVVRQRGGDEQRVLQGLPHPSGANIERIQYFLEKKDKDALSVKVNPGIIERGRAQAQAVVAGML
jgi:hypothetical protein